MLPETKEQRLVRLKIELRNVLNERERATRLYFKILDRMERLFSRSRDVRLFVALTQAKDNRNSANTQHLDSMISLLAKQVMDHEDVNDEVTTE